jgi:ribosomal protein S27AE
MEHEWLSEICPKCGAFKPDDLVHIQEVVNDPTYKLMGCKLCGGVFLASNYN